jgi:hypothetical protein
MMVPVCDSCAPPPKLPQRAAEALEDAERCITQLADQLLSHDWRACPCPGSKFIRETLEEIKEARRAE